jgi:hypothetical protein
MADAAQIGATASNYIGDVSLGGGTFGAFKLNTQPFEDFAKYAMLYNKAEYDQRQKDVEKAATEIADVTSYDLTTGIPKDAKLLQEKYDKLNNFLRDNPSALDYRNKKQWAEYKRMRNDLDNDLVSAKVRNTMWALRQKEIQDQTDEATRKLMQEDLDREIAATDIRTPLKHSQQYADNQIKLPDAPELTFDVIKELPNGVITRNYKIFNVSKAAANSDVFSLGLDQTQPDLSTEQGKRDAISRKKNFWLQGADIYNSIINAKDANGEFINKKKIVDPVNGNVTYQFDESKLSRIPRNLVNIAKDYNKYINDVKADINAGYLKDKTGKTILFGAGALDEGDYKTVNYEDGISPEELATIAQYAKWKGDSYDTKYQETDDAIQKGQLGVSWYNATHSSSGSGGGATSQSGITTPAILFGEHINRLKEWFGKNPNQELIVGYTAVDDGTRKAIGLETGNRVIYKPDGSFVIQSKVISGIGNNRKETWQDLKIGNVEDVKQGFINSVKGGLSADGTQTKEFQDESEKGFSSIFGTTSGSMIFNQWGKSVTSKPPAATEDNTINISEVPAGVDFNKGTKKSGTYTENGKYYYKGKEVKL